MKTLQDIVLTLMILFIIHNPDSRKVQDSNINQRNLSSGREVIAEEL